ncbi:heterokaryon incompatibility protein-domain-containing protein [Fusarium tricinctum]|uniref:Heterokaryon incompatibility protein-domain-containing protein n=1 Tax=Fusarium tricinctum TaxID=61284 RepID=A0A8K0WB72_9HYPO|nr:heterokaryon incompatibility protein-domain-containing protein [Fusarium tricinctum]
MTDLLPSAVPPPSCTLCKFSYWNTEIGNSDKFYHAQILDKYEDLQRSAHLGCSGCILLHEVWVWCIPDEQLRSSAWLSFNIDTSKMYFHLFKQRVLVFDIEIFTLPEACEKLHERCSEATEFTPLRLFDLQPSGNDYIQLVSVTNARYPCLSHCWGNTRSKHLTKRVNLLANEKGIPLSELPMTFQDAISVTKALGIRYLWVDSFCIIQDDEKDWEAQASLMASIYENAYITLAAGASANDDGGFFAHHEIYMRHGISHPDCAWPVEEVLPLMTRAWVLQERLLAKRYLCFGSQEIFWECQEDVSCSCAIVDGPFNPRDGLPKFERCRPLKYQCSRLNDIPLEDVASLWRELVQRYTCRDLTKPTDKLYALAGLAKRFQVPVHICYVLDSSYLAGLWLKSLRKDLGWCAYGRDTSLGRVRKYPSWTWVAASDAQILWPWLKLHSTFQIKGTSFNEATQRLNQHAYNESCHLLISGLIRSVSIQSRPEPDDFEKAYPLARNCLVLEDSQLLSLRDSSLVSAVDCTPGNKSHEEVDGQRSTMQGTFCADYYFWNTETEFLEALQHVYFLFLGIGKVPDSGWVAGMVLKPRSGQWDEPHCSYQRIVSATIA